MQELNGPQKVSSTWFKHLYELVDKLNDTEMQQIGMSLKDTIKLKENYFSKKLSARRYIA